MQVLQRHAFFYSTKIPGVMLGCVLMLILLDLEHNFIILSDYKGLWFFALMTSPVIFVFSEPKSLFQNVTSDCSIIFMEKMGPALQ